MPPCNPKLFLYSLTLPEDFIVIETKVSRGQLEQRYNARLEARGFVGSSSIREQRGKKSLLSSKKSVTGSTPEDGKGRGNVAFSKGEEPATVTKTDEQRKKGTKGVKI